MVNEILQKLNEHGINFEIKSITYNSVDFRIEDEGSSWFRKENFVKFEDGAIWLADVASSYYNNPEFRKWWNEKIKAERPENYEEIFKKHYFGAEDNEEDVQNGLGKRGYGSEN